MQTTTLDLSADIIDVRDIIARVEELESEKDNFTAPNRDGYKTSIGADEVWKKTYSDEAAELAALQAILDELKGYGGDEQWRGDWYPVTLIRDSYFIDYARELLEECGDIPRNLPRYIAIDWKKTAMTIRQDYSHISLDATYWYR